MSLLKLLTEQEEGARGSRGLWIGMGSSWLVLPPLLLPDTQVSISGKLSLHRPQPSPLCAYVTNCP